jgi:hypothetical protein
MPKGGVLREDKAVLGGETFLLEMLAEDTR